MTALPGIMQLEISMAWMEIVIPICWDAFEKMIPESQERYCVCVCVCVGTLINEYIKVILDDSCGWKQCSKEF